MKNKLLALICATMLSVCCLGLAACGGGTSSASGSAASASSSAADPTAKFIGEWQLAGAKMQGVTVAGDFSGIFGQDVTLKMDVKDAGKGSLTFNGETKDITWEADGDDAIVIKPVDEASASAASASASAASASASAASASASAASASSESLSDVTSAFGASDQTESLTAKYDNETLVITTKTEQGDVDIVFSADGTLADMPIISADGMKNVESESAAIGTWTISGINLMGATMYGDMSSLSQVAGGSSSTDMTLVIEEGGKAKLMGEEVEWTFDSTNGLQIGDSTMKLPVKMLGDDLALDMGQALGGSAEMIMVFSK